MERAECAVLRADAAAVYVHVDDIVLGKAGKCAKAANYLIHKVAEELRRLAFKVMDATESPHVEKIV
eukprot:9591394-Alexandrium_andersonii.AAC.1